MAETPAPVAALDGAVVRFAGRARPIGPLTLSVRPGEILALVGASGAGKSTALSLLAGLRNAEEGGVRPGPAGRVGMVFQSPTLAPWIDVLTNVALPLELAGTPREAARDRARAALTSVGLGDRTGALPRQLSGGMAMRAALARALVVDPDLLLLDEPFAALDTVTRRRLIEALHAQWAVRAPRPAVVFVTHDVEEAVYLAGRVVVLGSDDGRVRAEIVCPGVLPRPADHRADPAFRAAVDAVAEALAVAMDEVAA